MVTETASTVNSFDASLLPASGFCLLYKSSGRSCLSGFSSSPPQSSHHCLISSFPLANTRAPSFSLPLNPAYEHCFRLLHASSDPITNVFERLLRLLHPDQGRIRPSPGLTTLYGFIFLGFLEPLRPPWQLLA